MTKLKKLCKKLPSDSLNPTAREVKSSNGAIFDMSTEKFSMVVFTTSRGLIIKSLDLFLIKK